MRRRFFVDRFEGSTAAVRGETAEHLGRVLRAERGQLYELSDGSNVWLARVANVRPSKGGKSEIEFELVEPIAAHEQRVCLRLLLSIIKFDRFEWCLEKATELGVAEITPLAAVRTDKALIAASAKRRARWAKILVESAQQSRQLYPPILHTPARAAEVFSQAGAGAKILLSERSDAKPLRQVLESVATSEATVAMGPEGGWTDEEVTAARAAGFAEASLGENILRTETAVIATVAIVRFALEPKS